MRGRLQVVEACVSDRPDTKSSPSSLVRSNESPGGTERANEILADSSLTDRRLRILKHSDTFAVFDQYGNIRPVPGGDEGIYHDGTRFVSGLVLELEGAAPFFLSSTIRDDNDQLVVALTNPDLRRRTPEHLPLGSLHIARRIFLRNAECYQEVVIENHTSAKVSTRLGFRFAADFADIFEIRGMTRQRRGQNLAPAVNGSTVDLRYKGLDEVERLTRFEFPALTTVSHSIAGFDVSLGPRESANFQIAVSFQSGGTPAPRLQSFETARELALEEIRHRKAGSCVVHGSNGQFNAWIDRSLADLQMMTTALPTGPYPYAGVPWFNAPFGRDGLITALECLWFWPELARGVLSFLARHQATDTIANRDAEPGKIVHEMRSGEMAAMQEMPFGKYYGAVDGTPLFLLLAGAYYERTGDLCLISELWPHLHAAMRWIDEYGDRDGDGFVEYRQVSSTGLIHQGWKDGDDAIFHEDGSEAVGPIALCEVQSYVYAAWQSAAKLADALGLHDQAELPKKRAARLRDNFGRAFWCQEISSFALAIDGAKRPCRVPTSNAGHCLFSGLATRDHALLAARTLMSPTSFSGWGVRTVAEGGARYNPMAYHNGSVWPHDNALIASGFGRYGLTREALAIFQGMFEASVYFEFQRMPELFCGFRRESGEGPVLYPVACSPQSWAAASVFLLLQSSLGLKIDGIGGRISFVRPVLPPFLNDLKISNLRVGAATVDLRLTRHGEDASVKVVRRTGELEILVSH